MKKTFLILLLLVGIVCTINSCHSFTEQPPPDPQAQIDSLKEIIADMKPGLGEIMLGIQTHHAKLYFAGKNSNWKLADFEMNEIRELLEQAKKIETDRPEINSLPMLFPALDSLSISIKNKNEKLFESDFATLTTTCNACHTKVKFEFNVITIPTAPPVTNQKFAVDSN